MGMIRAADCKVRFGTTGAGVMPNYKILGEKRSTRICTARAALTMEDLFARSHILISQIDPSEKQIVDDIQYHKTPDRQY